MTLLDHVVLQVEDLNAIGDWYDQIVSLAGGARTFDMPNLIGYALPGQPAQLFFSLATDPGGRQTHLARSGSRTRPPSDSAMRSPPHSAPKSSTSPGCGRSTDRTTTQSSSATQPETISNSSAKPERHGQRSRRNPLRRQDHHSQLTQTRRRNTHYDHHQHHRLRQLGHRHQVITTRRGGSGRDR